MNQRGSVGIYFLFSVIVAAAAGYGAYHYIHEHKAEFRSDEHASTSPTPAPRKPKPPAPAPTPAPDPIPEAPVPAAPEQVPTESPAQVAARLAIDPVDTSESPSFGTPGVVGGIEKRAVDRRFRPHAEQLQTCYEHASAFDGSVRVTMEVQPNGKLAQISLDDGDDGFQACMIAALNVSFSATKDGLPATIVQPIQFH